MTRFSRALVLAARRTAYKHYFVPTAAAKPPPPQPPISFLSGIAPPASPMTLPALLRKTAQAEARVRRTAVRRTAMAAYSTAPNNWPVVQGGKIFKAGGKRPRMAPFPQYSYAKDFSSSPVPSLPPPPSASTALPYSTAEFDAMLHAVKSGKHTFNLSDARRQALSLYSQYAKLGMANGAHLAALLQFCRDSEDCRMLIKMHMVRPDTSYLAKPSTAPFVELAKRLLLEGDDEAARNVAKREIPDMFGPDNMSESVQKDRARILSSVSNANEVHLSLSRGFLLEALLRADHPLTWKEASARLSSNLDPYSQADAVYKRMHESQKESRISRQAAKYLLGRLAAEGKADVAHYNIMLKYLDTSKSMLQLLEIDMLRIAGIYPDDESIRILADQLILEGDEAKALHLIAQHLDGGAFKVEVSDTHTGDKTDRNHFADSDMLGDLCSNGGQANQNSLLLERIGLGKDALNSKGLAIRRLQKLELYRNQEYAEGTVKLESFFESLNRNDVVDTSHYNFAVLHRKNTFSHEKRYCIDVAMPAAGLEPDASSYLMLVQQLVLEGDLQSAQQTIQTFEERSANCPKKAKHFSSPLAFGKELERMRSALNICEEKNHRRRKRYLLNEFLRDKGPPDTEAAMQCLRIFDRNGVAHSSFLKAIIKRCPSTISMITALKEANELDVGTQANAWVISKLIQQLALEGNYRAAYGLCQSEQQGIPLEITRESQSYFEEDPVTPGEVLEWTKEVEEDAKSTKRSNSNMRTLLQSLTMPRNQKIKHRMTRLNLILQRSFEHGFELYTCFASNCVADSPAFWRMVVACKTSEQLDNVLNVTRGCDTKTPKNAIDVRVKQRAYDKFVTLLLAEGKFEYARKLVSKDLNLMQSLDGINPLQKTRRLVESHDWALEDWAVEVIEGQRNSYLGTLPSRANSLDKTIHKLPRDSGDVRKMSWKEYDATFRKALKSITSVVPKSQTPFEVKQRLLAEYHAWKLGIAKGGADPRIVSRAAKQAHRLLVHPLSWCGSADEIRDIIQTELHDEYALAVNGASSQAFPQEPYATPDSEIQNFDGSPLELDDPDHNEFKQNKDFAVEAEISTTSSAYKSFPILPGPAPYVALIKRLLINADYDGANEVLAEMSEHGIPTKAARKALEIRNDPLSLSKLRTFHMSKWCVRGHKDSEACRNYVLNLLDRLVQCGEADVYHFNVAMRFCETSEEIQHLVDGLMSKLKVKPSMNTYRILLQMLFREGNYEKAWDIMDNDLKVLCFKNETDSARKRFFEWVQTRRTSSEMEAKQSLFKLQNYCLKMHAQEGTPEAWQRANNFYEDVMKRCYTARSAIAQNIMLQWCSSSQEMQEWLRAQKVTKLHPNVAETIVKQMILEGDVQGALSYMKTVDNNLSRNEEKVQNHLNFWKNMNAMIHDEDELDQNRLRYVKRCIERGTLLDEAKVRAIFAIWRENGDFLEISEDLEKLENHCFSQES